MFKLFKHKPIPDYQAELSWKYPERPVLMAWHRWAIPYNLLHIKVAYSFFILVASALGAVMYSTFLDDGKPIFQWSALFTAILSGGFFLAFFTPMVFEHKIYVYRCTAEGLEVCSWKEGYKKWIVTMKIIVIIAVIVIIFIALHTKQIGIIFMAFVGPAGIGLMSLGTMTSKNFIEHQRDFDQEERNWNDIIRRILIDKNRKIISLEKITYWQDEDSSRIGAFPIFCDRDRFEEILAFIKKLYPDLPCEKQRAKIDSFKSFEGKPQTEAFNYGKNPTRPNK